VKKAVQIINIIITILTIYVAIIAATFVVPRAFGVMPYIVLSGSMEPSIPTGSVAFINQRDRDVEIGDVVTFRLGEEASIETGTGNFASAEQGTLVTHRIVNRTENGTYITKGDANEVEDMVELVPSQIVGTYIFNIPKLGSFMQRIGSHTMTMILIGLIVLNIVTSLLSWAWDENEGDDSNKEADDDTKEENESDTENTVTEESEEKDSESHDVNEENSVETEKEDIEKEKTEEKMNGDAKEEETIEDSTEDLSKKLKEKSKKEEI
jgi:signal peptidase